MTIVPSIRTCRWVWLAATMLIGIAWVGSMWCGVRWHCTRSPAIDFTLTSGTLWVRRLPSPAPRTGLECWWNLEWNSRWLPDFRFNVAWKYAVVPLWIPLAACAPFTVVAFRRAARFTGPGACRACGYSLSGLARGARCPECGGVHGRYR